MSNFQFSFFILCLSVNQEIKQHNMTLMLNINYLDLIQSKLKYKQKHQQTSWVMLILTSVGISHHAVRWGGGAGVWYN